jgi:hypothetical protein
MIQPIHPMLERVARAMLADDLDRPGVKRDFDSVWEDEAPAWIASARAAIQALLEPDEVRLAAGRQVTCDEQASGGVVYSTDAEAKAIYRAMLLPLIGKGE